MAEVKWIKITTNVFDDEKIRVIETMPEGDTIIVLWFKLLCLAGKSNESGYIMMTDQVPYTEEMLVALFNRPILTVQLALKTFKQFNMIEVIDNILCLPNWEKHQNIEGLDKIRLQNKDRQQKHRDKLKNLRIENKEEDIDKELDIEKERDSNVTVTLRKTTHLEYVKLTEIEYDKLLESYGLDVTKDLIDRLNNYIGSKGKDKYKSHYHTIKNWIRSDEKKNPTIIEEALRFDAQGNLIEEVLK